jgi:hypothetical protein
LGDESELEHLDIDPTWNNDGADVKKSSKIRPKNVRKEPFWVKNDGECKKRVSSSERSTKMVECWPIIEESSEFQSKRSKEKQNCSKKLSYESTGPHDERYYGEIRTFFFFYINHRGL